MKHKINYAGPLIDRSDLKSVKDAVINGFYENYKVHVLKLEEKLCKKLNVKYALAVNSCTAAIHLALASLNLSKNDEVITSDSSCVASALPIIYVGAKAKFVDVDLDTHCMSPKSILRAITKKTKAIIVVHWNGIPANMKEIMKIAKKFNLHVIEDAAPSLGAEYYGKKIGTLGDVGCYSFQGAKVAIGGQGGALVTNNKKIYKKAKILSAFGRTDSKKMYWSDYVGWNYQMPNLPAALALSQVSKLNNLVKRKRQIFKFYIDNLKNLKGKVTFAKELKGSKATYCYPLLMLEDTVSISRNKFVKILNKKNIDCRVAQPRISKMPMFKKNFSNINSQKIEDRGVILPSAFNLTKQDLMFVCENIKKIILK
jgi:perosamine synthetase